MRAFCRLIFLYRTTSVYVPRRINIARVSGLQISPARHIFILLHHFLCTSLWRTRRSWQARGARFKPLRASSFLAALSHHRTRSADRMVRHPHRIFAVWVCYAARFALTPADARMRTTRIAWRILLAARARAFALFAVAYTLPYNNTTRVRSTRSLAHRFAACNRH